MIISERDGWVNPRHASVVYDLFCRNCCLPRSKHVDGKCLFDSTSFEFASLERQISLACAQMFEGRPATERTLDIVQQYAAYLRRDLCLLGFTEKNPTGIQFKHV